MNQISKQKVLVNLQKLQDNFELELVENRTGAFEKYGVLITYDNGCKYLIIVEGLTDNGVNNAETPLNHWLYDGFVWSLKSKQRLTKENELTPIFVEAQNFNIWTSAWKYCKLVNGQIVYLTLDSDIYDFGDEILKEKMQEDGTSFEPKQYESHEPKQFEKTLKAGVTDSYSMQEMVIREMQLNDIINRF
jgi:hypothetical protein